MKLTESKLKQIIAEELQKVLTEESEQEVLQEESPRDAMKRIAKEAGGFKALMALPTSNQLRQDFRKAFAARKAGKTTVDFAGLRAAGMALQQKLGLRGKGRKYADLPPGVKPGDVLGALRAAVGKVLRPNEIKFDKGSVVFADDNARAKAMAYLEKIDPDGKLFGGPERIQRAIAGASRQSPALRNILRKDTGEIADKMKRAMDAADGRKTMVAPVGTSPRIP